MYAHLFNLKTLPEVPDSVEYDDSHPKEYSVSPFLVLDNGTQQSTFTFTTSSSFIQIEPQELTDYQIRCVYAIKYYSY